MRYICAFGQGGLWRGGWHKNEGGVFFEWGVWLIGGLKERKTRRHLSCAFFRIKSCLSSGRARGASKNSQMLNSFCNIMYSDVQVHYLV